MTGTKDVLKPRGRFKVEHFRNGVLLQEAEFDNLIVNQGKNNILGVYFNNVTQTANTSWFIGLISNTAFTSIVAGDTAASHPGWTEFTGYSQTTRPAWGQGAPTAQTITNSSPVVFTINALGTVKGIFVITDSAKGGTAGILWAATLFPSGDTPVVNGDELRVTYSVGT